VLDGPYSDEEIDAAVQALADADRLAGARDTVARIAPALQRILDEALAGGGWFEAAHEDQVTRAVGAADPHDRGQLVRSLVAEETRLGMLVGVAVGIELARELAKHPRPHTHNQTKET
jgi:hypothetical protein